MKPHAGRRHSGPGGRHGRLSHRRGPLHAHARRLRQPATEEQQKQVPARHLLRHGARAGHPSPGAHEPDAARHRSIRAAASATAIRSRPRARTCRKATLILTNPPFGTKKGGGLPTRDDFTFPTSNKQFCFLQHIYRGLKPGGRAAVVLPDNVLFEGNVGTTDPRAT